MLPLVGISHTILAHGLGKGPVDIRSSVSTGPADWSAEIYQEVPNIQV